MLSVISKEACKEHDFIMTSSVSKIADMDNSIELLMVQDNSCWRNKVADIIDKIDLFEKQYLKNSIHSPKGSRREFSPSNDNETILNPFMIQTKVNRTANT